MALGATNIDSLQGMSMYIGDEIGNSIQDIQASNEKLVTDLAESNKVQLEPLGFFGTFKSVFSEMNDSLHKMVGLESKAEKEKGYQMQTGQFEGIGPGVNNDLEGVDTDDNVYGNFVYSEQLFMHFIGFWSVISSFDLKLKSFMYPSILIYFPLMFKTET